MDSQLDSVFAALADTTRRNVLRQLESGASTVTELAQPHDMSLTGFMKHLAVLEAAGLIARSKEGRVVSCELEQSALQKLLYDLEAGMPFLFINQLDVQVPQTTALNEVGTGRVRVILGVSGQWQAGK